MIITEDNRPNFCLTICGYRRTGMSQKDYVDYMTKKHAPLVSKLMVKYNIIEYTMSHNCATPEIVDQLFKNPHFSNIADYDCIVNIVFKDISDFTRLQSDPFYLEVVQRDHVNFADTRRSQMSIGRIKNFIKDTKELSGDKKTGEI